MEIPELCKTIGQSDNAIKRDIILSLVLERISLK
jgi:hypothetical protein